MDERAFIAALRAMAPHPAARGLMDDAAVLEIGGETLVITHDAMTEAVHFLPDQDPADVAWKLVATNLSDLAAKGAQPLGVLLGYQLAGDDARFLSGLGDVLAHYNVPLLGGDTIGGAGPQTLGLTALGRATHHPVPSRAGASPEDDVWITGPLGAALAGFEALQAGSGDSTPYRRPAALLTEGIAVAPHVSAMMDVSDGLLLDATRMAEASAVTLLLDSAEIPLALPIARRGEALRWGDDYQLLFTAPPTARLPIIAHRIGKVAPLGMAPLLLDGALPPAAVPLGYEHRPKQG